MVDPVHQTDSSPPRTESVPANSNQPLTEQLPPPPGTCVIQVPKDRISRFLPPENSIRPDEPRRSRYRRCFYWTFSILFLLLLLISVAAGILYLIYRPEAPKYSVDGISISGINLASSASISPIIDVSISARNTNDKLAIYYYEKGSSVDLYYSAIELCNGVVPRFVQWANNETVIQTALKGSNIVLGNGDSTTLVNQQRQGRVPLRLNLKVPVKIKFGAVKTWKITVKVDCDLTIDNLTANSKILSKTCDHSVKLW